MFKIDDEVASPNEGGLLKINREPASPNEGACLRYILNRACLRYMLNRNRQMRGRV